MEIHYPEIGICGLSCRLCPMYNTGAESRCLGCKSPARIAVGCPFITCAIKRKGVEFCWDCEEHPACEKWRKHREAGKKGDSFTCYQTLEEDIACIQTSGVEEFNRIQKTREKFLKEMVQEFNEGRSKSYYCIASTLLSTDELDEAMEKARHATHGLSRKEKSRVLHSLIDEIGRRRKYQLKLRKG